MEGQIILQGITIKQLEERFRAIVKEELSSDKQIYQLSKKDACNRLKISFPTLQKRMEREGLTEIYNTDLHKLERK